jgi:hypothetical protein
MGTPPLSPETEKRIVLLFAPDHQDAVRVALVDECGNSLPFLQNCDQIAMERFRFAVLKVSDGKLDKLRDALQLAKTDWRDLLVAAGFASDIHAHQSWLPVQAW